MPIYEFACRSCGHRFEALQRITDPTPTCPGCGSAEPTRLISLVAGLGGGSNGGSGGGCGCGGACACSG